MQFETNALVVKTTEREYPAKDGSGLKKFTACTLSINNELYEVTIKDDTIFEEIKNSYGKEMRVGLRLRQFGRDLALEMFDPSKEVKTD